MPPTDQPVRYYRYSLSSGWEAQDARVIAENNVSLSVNGELWLSFTCTPTDLEAMGIGFLYNEGLIESRDEVGSVTLCQEGTNIDVWLHHNIERPQQWRRTSGCTGGFTTITQEKPIKTAADTTGPSNTILAPVIENVSPEILLSSMEQLLLAQSLYRETRGVHCSALFDGQSIRLQAEDIGRHNTLDKLAGLALLADIHINPAIVLTTGRISSEMLQKSARLGAAVVVSRTSPTSMSIKMADELGIALVGYARRNQFLVYAHPERIGF